jgi:hypothetical protein
VVSEVLAGALSGSLLPREIPNEVLVSDRFERSMDCGHIVIAIDVGSPWTRRRSGPGAVHPRGPARDPAGAGRGQGPAAG